MSKWLFLFIPFLGWGQSFAPEPGALGSTAIHKDSSLITYWADNLSLDRGYLDLANPFLGEVDYGVSSDGEGPADGISVVSLGDSGVATYYFSVPFSDGIGPDFAVFENGFADHYLELAFVEVSSDDQNYFRFPALSEIPTDVQMTNFDFINCGYVHNLAGKYRANYGTPFDLSELDTIIGLDITAITSIRIVDVVGSIDPNWGSMDSQGRMINDPYPTAFPSGGFDLDGLALLQPYVLGISEQNQKVMCSPNPVVNQLQIEASGDVAYTIRDVAGTLMLEGTGNRIDCHQLPQGVYIVTIIAATGVYSERILKQDGI